MDSTSANDGASAAPAVPSATPVADVATADPAAAQARGRRLSPKLLIVAGAATLVLALGGGAAALLWPATPAAADKVARAGKPAKSRKPAKAVAPPAAASAVEAVEVAASTAPRDTTPTTPVAKEPEPLVAGAPVVAHGHTPAAPPSADAGVAADEQPIDRLRRRLGEVISGKGQLEAIASGDLRLRTRATQAALVPTNHNLAPGGPPPATGARGRTAATPESVRWAYDGKTGPHAWGRLRPEFATCGNGQRQSPIDIRDGVALDLEPLQFDYRASAFAVIDNGHTVQVNVAPGNFIEAQGTRWQLQQFHFHRPSEERLDGRRFEMVVHLVHRHDDGRLAMLAVLLERGAAQPLLQTVWNHLPLEKHEEATARVMLDINQLLPDDRRYYTYMGSMTTPPCSEGVLWLVLQKPVQLSDRQIDIFARLYPMNARPVQSASGRMIKQSN